MTASSEMIALFEKAKEDSRAELQFSNYLKHNLSHKEQWAFAELRTHIKDSVSCFSKVALGKEMGLEAFVEEDFLNYLFTDNQFNFALKRRVGRGILYGVDHAILRRQFFNKLPKSLRTTVFLSKIKEIKLARLLSTEIGVSMEKLEDVKDIGMGHSIYKAEFQTDRGIKTWVIKEKDGDLQVFYCELLQLLGWPSYQSYHLNNDRGQWEVSEFLGERNVNDRFQDKEQLSHLIKSLASHAALSDIMGRGDRHLENYIAVGSSVFPIDISYLFWPNNEMWTERYTSAGCYEINVLSQFPQDSSEYQESMRLFWEHYEAAFYTVVEKQKELYDLITTFFGGLLAKRYCSYLDLHLDSPKDYIDIQKKRVALAVEKMKERRSYKKTLQELFLRDPEKVQEEGLLYMYYLADLKRSTCFLHSDERWEAISQKITMLAKD